MLWKILVAGGVIVALAALAVVTVRLWQWRQRADTSRRTILGGARAAHPIPEERLPPVVRRYLDRAMPRGGEDVRTVRLRQDGAFRMGPDEESWRRFRAEEVFRVHPPAFQWDARIRAMPLVSVRVMDRYLNGRGSMLARVGGVATVVNQSGEPGLNAGALARYLAEAVWIPPRLASLPGLHWSAVEEETGPPTPPAGAAADATLGDGETEVTVRFHFDEAGDVVAISGTRPREVDGRYEDTPWVGRFDQHREMGGFRIPARGEVAWVLDGREQVYWRGRILSAEFGVGA